MSRRRDLSRECDCRGAAAAPDIDDALARRQVCPIDHKVGDRLEQHVLRRLTIGPALAGGTVPVSDLIRVLFVAGGGVHVRNSQLIGDIRETMACRPTLHERGPQG